MTNRLRGGLLGALAFAALASHAQTDLDSTPGLAAAREWLADKGYDPAYGARPLKRVMQRHLQDPLAEKILAGEIGDGASVEVSANAQGLLLNGDAVKAEAA